MHRTGIAVAGTAVAAISVLGNADTAAGGGIGLRAARRLGVAAIVSALACLCGTAALAQWSPHATASLGRSYGNLALGQSILSGTRRLGNASVPAVTTPSQIEAALGYTADPEVSDHTRRTMIDNLSSDNPALRAYLEKSFADNTKLKEFDGFMSAHGISGRTVADSMAALLWVSWEIVNGGPASPAQVRGVHEQVRGVFLGTPRLTAMTNAQRQEMAERLAYQVMINVAANTDALRSGDPAQVAHTRQTVAGIVRQQAGVDLSRLRLSDNGFRRKS
jgi:uncharacterized protein DUF6683